MKQATIDAFVAFVQERMGEYPSNYQLQNVGNGLVSVLLNEVADNPPPASAPQGEQPLTPFGQPETSSSLSQENTNQDTTNQQGTRRGVRYNNDRNTDTSN